MPFGVIVHLALCGSHEGKNVMGHELFWNVLSSQRLSFHILVCVYLYLPFPVFFIFLLHFIIYFLIIPTCVLASFLAGMIFLLDSNLMLQLLSLGLHSASYLFYLSTIFIIISGILTSSSSGLYNFWYSFIFFSYIYFSAWYVFLYLFSILCIFEHFVFLLQNCQIIWGLVCVCDVFLFTHDLLTPFINYFSLWSVKARLGYHFWFSDFGVKVSLQSKHLLLVLLNI